MLIVDKIFSWEKTDHIKNFHYGKYKNFRISIKKISNCWCCYLYKKTEDILFLQLIHFKSNFQSFEKAKEYIISYFNSVYSFEDKK